MLDVHPPHHPVHAWRDFFIHIATIVVGLLIAIGLEQTVEYFHHRHQVADAREALHQERLENEQMFALSTRAFAVETKRFQSNLNVLVYIQNHPNAQLSDWPAPINWHNRNSFFADSAWTTIERSNITELMPQSEVRDTDRLYKLMGTVVASYANRLVAIRDARVYMTQDFDPAHLTPAQLAEEIQLAKTVIALHYRLGSDMRNMAARYKDFAPAPTTEELDDVMNEPHRPEFTAQPSVSDLEQGPAAHPDPSSTPK